MFELLFPVLGGAAFVWLGRWMYQNPKKVYPNWACSNPDHPFLLSLVRVFATLMIFAGSCGSSAIVLRFLPDYLTIPVMLGVGIACAWFLRPRLQKAVVLSDGAQPPSRGFLSKEGKWVVGISLGIAVLFVLGAFAMIGNSEVCKAAVSQAQSNTAAVEQLGQPIKRGFIVSGSIEANGPSAHADIAIPLSGPKGKGTLYAVGVEEAGIWRFGTLQLAVDGHTDRLNLLDSSAK